MTSDGGEARLDAVDKALAAARIHRRRGDLEAAWRAVDDALALAPEWPPVLEAMGDLSYDDGDFEAASRCYRRALDLEPGRATAELGYANAVLAMRGELAADDQPDEVLLKRRPADAAARSGVIPGLGQAYANDPARAAAFFGPWMVLLVATCWRFMGALSEAARSRRGLGGVVGDPLMWCLGVLLLALHVASAVDAYRLLQRHAAPRAAE